MTEIVEEPLPQCAHCHRELSRRGTPGLDGDRYCSKRRPCKQARDRARYAQRFLDDGPPMETRPCSYCGIQMPPRPERVTDSPIGRCCQQTNCKRKHRAQLERIPELMERYETARAGHAEFFSAAKVTCPVCGRENAREGFLHPDVGGHGECAGVGGRSTAMLEDIAVNPPSRSQTPCDCPFCSRRREASATL